MGSIVVGRLGLCGRVRGAVLPMPLELVWLHGARRRADAVSAAAVVPDVALSRVIGGDRATYPTTAAGGAGRQRRGARRGVQTWGTSREGPLPSS